MDPKALLDYALFQLTPTRTRCDLVVFSGGISEKLASGLVEPFLHHLKFAKDQIPKGGYSIALQPPKTDAFWFTKATFERFVRFVSTPEVLERFARLEKEISQIESSVQSSEFAGNNVAGQAEEGSLSIADEISKQSINSSKLKREGDGNDDGAHEENSKIHLQRLLETRKGLLRKEQAMAYARALAAGFELDNIDDLIFFAEAFGASRLREACTDFKELCKKKHKDGLWMDELAAMEACSPSDLPFLGTSGIMLACESTPLYQNNMLNFQNNGVSGVKLVSNGSLDVSSADSTISQANSDSGKDNNVPTSDQVSSAAPKNQGQMPWPNQFPHYMFNFQNPVQPMPPYQAYPFPSLQPIPPYCPGNLHHPQNMDEYSHGLTREPHRHQHRHQGSSSSKEKSPNADPGTSEEDEQTESIDSDTGTDSEMIALQNRKQSPREQPYKKRHGKKSSKTVVIRNINYITSSRRNEEKDEVSCDSSSVEDELVDKDSLKQKVEDVVGSFEKHHKPTLNNKKRGSNKSSSFVNGSNGSADEKLENDPLTNVSEGGEGKKHWDAFQNLLLKEKESTGAIESQQPLDVLDEHFTIKSPIEIDTSVNFRSVQFDSEKVQRRLNFETDSFVATERNEVDEGRLYSEDFGNGKTLRPSMKRSDCAEEALLLPQRSEESRSILLGTLSNGTESSVIKNGKAEDWFIVNHSRKSESQDITIEQAMFDGGYALSSKGDRSDMEKSKKIVPIDDSFMVQAQTSIDDQCNSHWKTDISMVSDIIIASQPENGIPDAPQKKIGLSCEPDDLCVVLARNSELESAGPSWSPELDYGVETSFTESDKKNAGVETNLVEEKIPMNSKSVNGKNSAGPGPNNSAKQLRSKGLRESLTKSKSDVLVKSKKPLPTSRPVIQKSKLEKEEEARKRMEELVIQRQKRITERTAASGLTPTISKKVPVGSKGASPKYDKHRPQSTTNLRKTNAKVAGAVNV